MIAVDPCRRLVKSSSGCIFLFTHPNYKENPQLWEKWDEMRYLLNISAKILFELSFFEKTLIMNIMYFLDIYENTDSKLLSWSTDRRLCKTR